MRIWGILAVLCALVLSASIFLVVRADGPEWTSSSPEALRELDLGFNDWMRFYHQDAKKHFEKSLTLDPALIPAKVMLLDGMKDEKDKPQRQQFLDELKKVDLAGYNPRERYFVKRILAIEAGDPDAANRYLEEFLNERPDDVWGLHHKASLCFADRDFERAETLFLRIIETSPNNVTAQNQLGYLAMARSKFAEAEERFRTYRFIAPDQANPHDSLAELLMLIGRHDEARAELEEALRVKPDFCPSYQHLIDLACTSGQVTPENVEALARRAEAAGCPDAGDAIRCRGQNWIAFWSAACLEAAPEACNRPTNEASLLRHRCLLRLGRRDEALAVEAELRKRTEEVKKYAKGRNVVHALLAHAEGIRAAHEGDVERASMLLQDADADLTFWGDGEGHFKLWNWLALASILEDDGQHEAAAQVVQKVRQVNPALADIYAAHPEVMDLGPAPVLAVAPAAAAPAAPPAAL